MRVLVIAPHNDDEILGVGGTIAKYIDEGHEVVVCEVTSGDPELWKMIVSEANEAHKVLGVKRFECLHLPVVELKNANVKIVNEAFNRVIQSVSPNIVFLPHKGDIHSDHQETFKAAMVALRPYRGLKIKAIYAYETLSETEWNAPSVENAFIPDTWNDISSYFNRKAEALKCYQSQLSDFPNPRSLMAVEALARLRGSTVGFEYAEAFMTVRSIL